MLRYLAILGLLTTSFVSAADATLLVQAEARLTSDGETANVKCEFTTKSGRSLSFTAGDAAKTKFEFTIKSLAGTETPIYAIDVRITRGDKVLSRPSVQTLAGRTASVSVGDGAKQVEFSVLIEPAK